MTTYEHYQPMELAAYLIANMTEAYLVGEGVIKPKEKFVSCIRDHVSDVRALNPAAAAMLDCLADCIERPDEFAKNRSATAGFVPVVIPGGKKPE